MSIAREQILEKRKRFERQKEKAEAKIRKLQEKLKKASQKIAQDQKKEENERKMILGNFVLEKIKTDASFKTLIEGEVAASNLGKYEKSLLGMNKEAPSLEEPPS